MSDSKMIDSKWQFCLRLKRFFRTCFIADSRVSAHYERGWNDAVTSLMASIGPLYKGQVPFLKTLLEDTEQPIPRATVAAALAALRKELADTIETHPPDEGSRLYDAATRTAVCGLDAVITRLGLELTK